MVGPRISRLTAHYNTHLSHLLHPTSPNQPSSKKLPRPSPSLHQLRGLLYVVDNLERHRGFKPDGVTANLILGCWLRCGVSSVGIGHHGGSIESRFGMKVNWRVYRSKEGWKVGWKRRSRALWGKEDVRMLFEIIARIMEKNVGIVSSTSPRSHISNDIPDGGNLSLGSSEESIGMDGHQGGRGETEGREGGEEQGQGRIRYMVEYDKHILPFCKMVVRAMRDLEDHEGVQMVLVWKAGMRDQLKDGMKS
ncbi:hypothetical protein TREMEDRAFT_57970 [Tremella mesenterica DSM 1558]|uniref:uncharacterized protein n=1 Tax=Tremella mesenterica (strain ATCC 24925 / CBS 8224 / DSM 1558 / NBRC 9311 / NRRL Y-6157 / RJB 2259-6 / UBC 559-6) TaxID=578456 RepID=UPI00032BB71E|nr:uncharacterized protein TREMEDRAFT_57970 [Tremella mesenterica DSM 1558]EIW65639.1 hypothetical protein TREMEDRAFT_57970 [Tremella mesenterica DSM 1558]